MTDEIDLERIHFLATNEQQSFKRLTNIISKGAGANSKMGVATSAPVDGVECVIMWKVFDAVDDGVIGVVFTASRR